MFIIFGQRLGPPNLTIVSEFPLPTSLAGTSVRVTVGGTSLDAYMIYTSPGQVAAVLPSNTPEGSGNVVVTFGGQNSAPAPISVVRSSWGTFTVNQAGSGPAIVQNFVTQNDQPINALTRPARPGQTAILWGTGLGPATGDERAGPAPGDLPINVEVYVGGQRANVTYKGRSGCCAGIDQIVYTIPEGVEGCYVPVVVVIDNAVSNVSTISVSRTGTTCTDPRGVSGTDIQQAQTTGNLRLGTISLSRIVSNVTVPGVGTADSKTDTGAASFFRFDLNRLLQSRGTGTDFGAVSMGACTVFSIRGTEVPRIVDPVRPDPLDAGSAITITGPRGTKQLTRTADGVYVAQLGGGITLPVPLPVPIPGQQPDYLEPGPYTISGPGGSDVGPFSVNLTIPQALTWTNMSQITNVDRAQGQLVAWSGGDPNGYVIINGVSSTRGVSAGFVCLERNGAGQFNIPRYVLANLPPTTGENIGLLSVSGSTVDARFTANGLDAGYVNAIAGNGKTVTYR
jgi:uncharacterized protein (TIGR03437 family)